MGVIVVVNKALHVSVSVKILTSEVQAPFTTLPLLNVDPSLHPGENPTDR